MLCNNMSNKTPLAPTKRCGGKDFLDTKGFHDRRSHDIWLPCELTEKERKVRSEDPKKSTCCGNVSRKRLFPPTAWQSGSQLAHWRSSQTSLDTRVSEVSRTGVRPLRYGDPHCVFYYDSYYNALCLYYNSYDQRTNE